MTVFSESGYITGGHEAEVVETVLTKLKSSPSKRRRKDDDMFQLPSTST